MDASAVLAYLNDENGAQRVEAALEASAWITTVNYCEVLSKLCEKGMPHAEAAEAVAALGMAIMPFDQGMAIRAAAMRRRTSEIGASLGDRACLALAEGTLQTRFTPTAYTAERSWAKIKWPFKVVVIRVAHTSTNN